LNNLILDNGNFLKQFGILDDGAYSDGVILNKYKKLTGLSISILAHQEKNHTFETDIS
jgi:hypothetical protein